MKGMCALTGHRALPPDFDTERLYDDLAALLKEGCGGFLCGMAEGFDLLSLRLLVELKEEFSFYLEACVPYRGQEGGYSEENRALYRDLIKKCDRVTVLEERYYKGCFLTRDRYMVECADFLFAYCTKTTGGTAYTVRYAKKLSRPVLFFGGGGGIP